MTQTPEEQAKQIVAEAARLLAAGEQQLADSEDQLRRLGLDPRKVREFAASGMDDQRKAELDAALREDMQAVEHAARQAPRGPSPSGPRPLRARNIV